MKISQNMDIQQLKDRMGEAATLRDAYFMRDLLSQAYDGQDTTDIDEEEWLGLCETAAEMDE